MATPAQMFARLRRYPLGAQLFSAAVCRRAPYFASISPLFRELKPGLAEVFVRNRRKVHNHLGTVNAIAMCAMCELAAGTMIDRQGCCGAGSTGSERWIKQVTQ